tara:strand:- start:3731 stop:4888 length:1158 start_codon:yes stop_codon:yes gene_type:complete
MATSFKSFLNNDVTTTRTLLHESIPITGSIVSGTYNQGSSTTETNIKNYSHGLFQSVYDYPYLSSSANHIFDITVGYSNVSNLSSSTNTQNADKINIYNQMAQLLVGHDHTGSIREFDEDGDLSGGDKLRECYFLNFARLLQKDEIKKGSFDLQLGVDSAVTFDGTTFEKSFSIRDLSGSTGYKVNSPAGEYGILYATASNLFHGTTPLLKYHHHGIPCGLIFYQAGVAVISGSVFLDEADGGIINNASGSVRLGNPLEKFAGDAGGAGLNFMTGSSISGSADAIRNRIKSVTFNNTTELNSTVYFARAGHSEFNYSSNPTYISNDAATQSQIRVKNSSLDQPVSYITTVGLYSADNELLAVAKVSEPLKKTPDTELTLRVRLDY